MPSPRRLYHLRDLADLPTAAEQSIVAGGAWTRGGKMLIAAPAGLGKTTLLHDLAAWQAAGKPWLGRFHVDRPRRVLVIQAELAEPELASHGEELLDRYRDTPAEDNLVFLLDRQLKLPRRAEELRAVVRDVGAEIFWLDPFVRFFEGQSIDMPEQIAPIFDVADRLIDDDGLDGVGVAHHTGVSKLRTAGSWDFEGWPSTIVRLEEVLGIATDRMLIFDKVRAPGFTLERMQIGLGDHGYLPIVPDVPAERAGPMLVRIVLADAGGQLRRQELLERVRARANCGGRAAAGYLAEARDAGSAVPHPIGRETVYRLAGESST